MSPTARQINIERAQFQNLRQFKNDFLNTFSSSCDNNNVIMSVFNTFGDYETKIRIPLVLMK